MVMMSFSGPVSANPMKPLLPALAVLFTLCLTASGETMTFPQRNFAIDIPAEMTKAPITTPKILLAVQSADCKKIFMLSVVRLPENKLPTGTQDVLAGIKGGFLKAGCRIRREERTTVGGLPFLMVDARRTTPAPGTVSAYAVTAGDKVYALIFMTPDENAMDDPDFQKILSSFHLLRPVKIQTGGPIPAPFLLPAVLLLGLALLGFGLSGKQNPLCT